MTTFISGPSILVLKERRHLQPQLHFFRRLSIPDAKFSRCRFTIVSRMRNKGGFHLPPLVPDDPLRKQRAIELLGNFTQKKWSNGPATQELLALIGEIPKSRVLAQQWKAMLQNNGRRKRHKENPSRFKNRNEIVNRIQLPDKDNSVGRCFILLGCLERRYRLDQTPAPRAISELERTMGAYPKDEKEAHHFIEALVFLQKKRRSLELTPPQIPNDDMEQLAMVNMLLGAYSVQGSVGRQTDLLYELLGVIPRSSNIAASWKKLIAAAIRKKKRKERTASRRAEIQYKRHQRRLQKQQCRPENSLPHLPLKKFQMIIEGEGKKVLESVRADRETASQKCDTAKLPFEKSGGSSFSYLQLLQGLFCRLFKK